MTVGNSSMPTWGFYDNSTDVETPANVELYSQGYWTIMSYFVGFAFSSLIYGAWARLGKTRKPAHARGFRYSLGVMPVSLSRFLEGNSGMLFCSLPIIVMQVWSAGNRLKQLNDLLLVHQWHLGPG